jgi:Peptidase family S41
VPKVVERASRGSIFIMPEKKYLFAKFRLALLFFALLAILGCAPGIQPGRDVAHRFDIPREQQIEAGKVLIDQTYKIVGSNYVDPIKADRLLAGAAHGLELYEKETHDPGWRGAAVPFILPANSNLDPITAQPGDNEELKIERLYIAATNNNPHHAPLEILEFMLNGALNDLDPYSTLLSPDEMQDLVAGTQRKFRGSSVEALMPVPGYGHIKFRSFRDTTAEDMKSEILKIGRGHPINGLILDFRDNPGGLLTQAIEVSDYFIDEGTILKIQSRHLHNTRDFPASPNGNAGQYPIVFLINNGSASASEIVAGALQDHGKALILGTTSFGKGSVQSVEQLANGYGLKLTIARYYTPGGKIIQGRGITPDISLDMYADIIQTQHLPASRNSKTHPGSDPEIAVALQILEEVRSNNHQDLLNTARKILNTAPN